MIEDMSIGDKLRMIENARLVFGRTAARHLWAELDLPDVPEIYQDRSMGQMARHEADPGVASFTARHVFDAPGCDVQAREMYDRYCVYATELDYRIISEKAFANEMKRLGFQRIKSRIRRYVGVSLSNCET